MAAPAPVTASGTFSRTGIDAPPRDGYVVVREGFAAVLFPPAQTKKKPQEKQPLKQQQPPADDEDDQAVFYNPAQVVNRDLSVCAISAFSQLRRKEPKRLGGVPDGGPDGTTPTGITILEALSASGLRALRYWHEIPDVKYIVANDLDPDALECIQRNAQHNGIPLVQSSFLENCPGSSRGVIPNLDDAVVLMQRLGHAKSGSRLVAMPTTDASPVASAASFAGGGEGSSIPPVPPQATPRSLLQQELMDVVDLDPYGSASPFLDAAFQCGKEGALFLVTSTDSAILCGNYPDTCHAKYNSIGIKGDACHEIAVRILLASIERAANKHSKYIVPLISLHIDFYVRCFFRVYTQPAEVKLGVCKLGYLYQCQGCPNHIVSPVGFGRSTTTKAQRKRQRGANAASAAAAGGDETATAAPADGDKEGDVEGQQQLEVAEFPAPPPRQQPFKVSANRLPSAVLDPQGCRVCGGHFVTAGPIYAATTQNRPFLQLLLATVNERAAQGRITAVDRVRGLVQAAIDELPNAPLFYSLPAAASITHSRSPSTPIITGALARLGYSFSQVHCDRSGIKVNCPYEVLIGLFLAHKQREEAYSREDAGESAEEGGPVVAPEATPATATAAPTALRCAAISGAVFSYDKQFDFRSSATGVKKFIPNVPGWGPKRRHQGVLRAEEDGAGDEGQQADAKERYQTK